MTTTKKSSPKPSRKVTVRTEVPGDIRPKLRAAYMYVVNNWAVGAEEVAKSLKIETDEATKLLKALGGLVEGTHVNGEKAVTWQSYYDIENSDKTKTLRSARADFAKAFPEPVVPGSSNRVGAKGATGPRYTEAQISAGIKAREAGKTNAEVAKAAGVKSPAYFSKVLKAAIAEREAAKKATAKKVRVTRSKAAKK